MKEGKRESIEPRGVFEEKIYCVGDDDRLRWRGLKNGDVDNIR